MTGLCLGLCIYTGATLLFNCSGHETVKLRRRLIEGLGGMEYFKIQATTCSSSLLFHALSSLDNHESEGFIGLCTIVCQSLRQHYNTITVQVIKSNTYSDTETRCRV